MKKTVLFMMMAVTVLTATIAQEKRYDFESAILKKNTVMKMQSMEQTLTSTQYIADYGRKESTEMVMNMQGQTFNVFTMLKDDYMYTANMTLKQGSKIKISAQMDDYKSVNFLNLTAEVKDKYKIEDKGSERFLGRDCKSYDLTITAQGQTMKVSVLIWQGLSLKATVQMKAPVETTVVEEVTEILVGVAAAKEKFELPEGINFVEMTAPR
jgi:hypothetical protein